MYKIAAIMTFALMILMMPIAVKASCPHCFEIIKVRAESIDGTAEDAYFVHYSEVNPKVTDSDGVEIISLEENKFYQKPTVMLIRNIYRFPEITTATTPEDIYHVDKSELRRLIFIDKIGFAAAGTINTYDRETIEMMKKPFVGKHKLESDLSYAIYLNYNPAVSDEVLERTARLCEHGLHDPTYTSGTLGNIIAGAVEHNTPWKQKALNWANKESTDIKAHLSAAVKMAELDSTGHIFDSLSAALSLTFDFHEAIKDFIETGDEHHLIASCKKIFPYIMDSIRAAQMTYGNDLKNNPRRFMELVSAFYNNFFLPESPTEEYLRNFNIIVVRNWWD